MWDLPGPGIEPLSPALAGGFLTTVPPVKSPLWAFNKIMRLPLTYTKPVWNWYSRALLFSLKMNLDVMSATEDGEGPHMHYLQKLHINVIKMNWITS